MITLTLALLFVCLILAVCWGIYGQALVASEQYWRK